ncbi:MAG TPA: GNAT family N-acetyltransferase [Symbiobacteriaceae bacterium]|nr:GNAT family N-acetyltransferase [Symbiobacteriaceae bacterium]
MGTVKRWQEYARQYGVAGLMRHLGARVIRPVWERASAQILVMQPPVPVRGAKIPLDIRVLRPDEAAKTALIRPGWEDRWSGGDTCYGAWVNGVCIHHSWVTSRNSLIGEVHGWLKVGPGEAYVYDCYTSASWRGQGVFPAVLSHIGRTLSAAGAARIWIAVEHENRSSIRAIERAGFALAGEVIYHRHGTNSRVEVKRQPDVPQFGFSTGSTG